MPNRRFDAEAEFSLGLSRQVDCEECSEQSTLSRQPDPLAQVTCRAGDDSCAKAHASTLNRTTDSQLSRSEQSLAQLQRQYGNCYVQRVLSLARKGEDEAKVSPDVEQAIQQSRSGGQALDSETRVQMESAFGADFSGVRVHADAGSDALNRSLNARAFTTGQDVFFRQGTYNPGSSSGRELLAHELTHVVQQTSDEIQYKLTVNAPGDRYEQEADRVAREVVQRQGEEEEEELLMPQVQRQIEDDDEEAPIQAKLEGGQAQWQSSEM
jgi:hypothetical protein